MLYVASTINKHCKIMEHSYGEHAHDHENKNVVSIHKFDISVILDCLVKIILYLALYIYIFFPSPSSSNL